MREITEEELDHWHEHGYAVVEELLDEAELKEARANVARYLPDWEEYARTPERYQALLGTSAWPMRSFPFVDEALNDVCTHPVLVALARRLLGTDDVALTHSRLRGKYAGAADYDQDLHVDYGNNTLVYPKADSAIFDLPCIVYYSDVTVDLGPTYVVSQTKTAHRLLHPRVLNRSADADVYEHEVPVTCPAGSAVIYSMRTFHRGSAMRAMEGARFSHHMGWRNGAYRWSGQETFQHEGGRAEMDHFLTRASPEQRQLVGFPPAGHPYWDDETLAGVAARYPGMDMTPYRLAAPGQG